MSIETIAIACNTCGAVKALGEGGGAWRHRRQMLGKSSCVLHDGIFCSDRCEPDWCASVTTTRIDIP